jgi:hypothetical protein
MWIKITAIILNRESTANSSYQINSSHKEGFRVALPVSGIQATRMKGIPSQIDGPRGPWYKHIRERIYSAGVGTPLEELVATLGDADRVIKKIDGHLYDPSMGSAYPVSGPTAPDFLFIYTDPLRIGREYHYALKEGRVVAWNTVRKK